MKRFARAGVVAVGVLTSLAGEATMSSAAAAPVKVVATFTILGDIVREIGGNDVAITTLVGPGGDAHVYQPTPADARALADADLVVVNGLGMEGWLDRLVKASGFHGKTIVASTGVKAIKAADDGEAAQGHGHDHDHGHPNDPHAWQAAPNAKIYADNVLKGLTAADPGHAAAFADHHARFVQAVEGIDRDIRQTLAAIPKAERRIVTSRDAFGYFAAAYGVTFIAPVGLSTDSEPSAGAVAKLIRQIKRDHIKAVFLESIADPRLLAQIARETGAKIGDQVFSDALSPADGPAPTYLAMMRHNLQAFTAALAPKS
jgi:zinc/manganese transport system substrate-binding protein